MSTVFSTCSRDTQLRFVHVLHWLMQMTYSSSQQLRPLGRGVDIGGPWNILENFFGIFYLKDVWQNYGYNGAMMGGTKSFLVFERGTMKLFYIFEGGNENFKIIKHFNSPPLSHRYCGKLHKWHVNVNHIQLDLSLKHSEQLKGWNGYWKYITILNTCALCNYVN